jgi:hypothetical protein
MTTEPSTDGLTFTDDCLGAPIRITIQGGCPWFEATDLCAAMDVNPALIDHFAEKALATDLGMHPFDAEPVPALSPIGHYKFVGIYGADAVANRAAWTRRKANELFPVADDEDPRFRLTLNADGSRPEYPNRYTGRLNEWKDLKCHPNYRTPRAIEHEQYMAAIVPRKSQPQLTAAEEEAALDAGISRLLAGAAARLHSTPAAPQPSI